MSASKETLDKDQAGDTPVEICQTKPPRTLGKRKIVAELCSPVKQPKRVEEPVENPDNCFACQKKLKFLSGFKCRCEHYFCIKHRFFDQHDCSFDYKAQERAKLRERNPQIVAKKLDD